MSIMTIWYLAFFGDFIVIQYKRNRNIEKKSSYLRDTQKQTRFKPNKIEWLVPRVHTFVFCLLFN